MFMWFLNVSCSVVFFSHYSWQSILIFAFLEVTLKLIISFMCFLLHRIINDRRLEELLNTGVRKILGQCMLWFLKYFYWWKRFVSIMNVLPLYILTIQMCLILKISLHFLCSVLNVDMGRKASAVLSYFISPILGMATICS